MMKDLKTICRSRTILPLRNILKANGIDAIHFSIGTEDRTGAPDMKAGWRNEYYKTFKKELHIPIYGPNEVKTPEEAGGNP